MCHWLCQCFELVSSDFDVRNVPAEHKHRVKRGLCRNPVDFKWSSAWFHLQSMTDPDLSMIQRPDPEWFHKSGVTFEASKFRLSHRKAVWASPTGHSSIGISILQLLSNHECTSPTHWHSQWHTVFVVTASANLPDVLPLRFALRRSSFPAGNAACDF